MVKEEETTKDAPIEPTSKFKSVAFSVTETEGKNNYDITLNGVEYTKRDYSIKRTDNVNMSAYERNIIADMIRLFEDAVRTLKL